MLARMNANPQRRRGLGFWLLVAAAAIAALLLLAPGAAAEGVGRLLGDLWVSTMGAVMSLIGAVLGA
jgi:hypothetical protein